ncbi:MAG: glycosyltransferase family 1 protein [Bacilli bacterium]|nr:glycosyltransferase family 1 protein [Bacilli bacterium]
MKKKDPIRIAQIMGKWLGGGVESVVMNYYRHIDRNKIQFDFICDDDSTNIPYEEIEKLGGRVILIPPYQKVFKYHKELKKILKEGNYKIVHSHINTLSVFSLWAAKSAKVPVRIAHSHSTTNKKEKKKNLLKQLFKPFSKLFATDYFCCSELSGRWLFGNKTYDKGKVFLLNNAIDLNKFKYDSKLGMKKRKELKINKDTLVIGHIGRFVEQKNHRFLIDIFNEIHKKEKDSILLLAGQGPLIDEIKKKVEDLNLNNSVRFLGQRNDANELYQVFDVFLLPSLYEGLPVVGVEAQSSGNLCYLSNDMTKETKVMDSTKFMSIDQSAEEWCNNILKDLINYKKYDTEHEISKYGFNIEKEANNLENKYSEIIIFERSN